MCLHTAVYCVLCKETMCLHTAMYCAWIQCVYNYTELCTMYCAWKQWVYNYTEWCTMYCARKQSVYNYTEHCTMYCAWKQCVYNYTELCTMYCARKQTAKTWWGGGGVEGTELTKVNCQSLTVAMVIAAQQTRALELDKPALLGIRPATMALNPWADWQPMCSMTPLTPHRA